jgi:(1->4)-alpha-D-glucan 1-alpha-D-glucosylmutase
LIDSDDLQRLCDLMGIQDSYQDGLGRWRSPPEDSRRAFLAAMGHRHDRDEDLQGRFEALEIAEWHRPLRPVMVCRQAAPDYHIPITLPVDLWSGQLRWTLEEEGGRRHEGVVEPEQLRVWQEQMIDDQAYERRGFDHLPPVPPGYHRFTLPDLDAHMVFVAAPEACFQPEPLAKGDQLWGLSVQVYSLRSARNWGIGDLSDLGAVGVLAVGAGADFIGVNPLHARSLADPEDCSPYAPSSRLFVDPLYLDPEAIPDFKDCQALRDLVRGPAFQARLDALRDSPQVDYTGVAALKAKVLEALYRHFRDHHLAADSPRARAFRDFVAEGGDRLRHFAIFEALRGRFRAADGSLVEWRDWPKDYGDPEAPLVVGFAAEYEAAVDFHCYLQWQADLQLGAVAQSFERTGMVLGLNRDLAVGPARNSAEAWSWQEVIAPGVSAGSPPDDFSPQGQVWNLPVFGPHQLREAAYRPLIELLRRNMSHAGALRIDHVMALARLFWIPDGAEGAAGGYVTYPLHDLLGILALESQRQRCLVVGEDLGSVPPGLRDELAKAGILATRVVLFERDGEGRFTAPQDYPRQAVVTPATHDLPTLHGFWLGRDLDWRRRLGLLDEADYEAALAARAKDRVQLLEWLTTLGLDIDPSAESLEVPNGLVEAVHRALADAPAMLIQVQLDDLVGEEEAVNLPGTWRDYPNWRRKLGTTLEELADDRRLAALARLLTRSGTANHA